MSQEVGAPGFEPGTFWSQSRPRGVSGMLAPRVSFTENAQDAPYVQHIGARCAPDLGQSWDKELPLGRVLKLKGVFVLAPRPERAEPR